MFYTYVLYSLRDRRWYTGATGNLMERMHQHEKGAVLSTRHRRPLRLVYYEACLRQAGLSEPS